MILREKKIAAISFLWLLVVAVVVSCQTTAMEVTDEMTPVNYAGQVNTTIGSKGKGFGVEEQYLEAGYTFPGATYPMGMVQFTPTFFAEGKGFVINQLSGAGCEHMGNLPTLPVAGELKVAPNNMMGFDPQYKINRAVAGYYNVTLGSNHVKCELTVTKRSGMARFGYPGSISKGTVIIGTGINSTLIKQAHAVITGKNTFEGYADGGSFCGYTTGYMVYFAGEFDQEPVASGTWKEDKLDASAKEADGQNSGLYFTFDVSSKKAVQYKVGISYVSIENAKKNLAVENDSWSFEAVKDSTMSTWNNYLGRIKVEGGSQDETTQFYTHLYHVFSHPSVFSDVNGEYVGADMKIHKAEGFTYYTGFSNWDTYRTQCQLISILAPKETSDMIASIIQFAEQSGGGWPRWVLANIETGIMQGDPTSALVANAYAFGARNFDTEAALKIMQRGAEIPGTKSQLILTRPHLEDYLKTGYTEASMSLEYNNADFAIGQFALQAFKDTTTYKTYLKRSQSWKKLYNPERKWLQSKNQDGTWKNPTDDWREASYKNYFWMIPYNLRDLIDTIGGNKVAEERLDEFFAKLNANYNQEWFAAGNEPDFQVPWIYNWVGAPAKTQMLVRRIIKEQYSNRNNGLPGNDDMGAMGAWYVYANIGLYPVIPGVGGFSINSPSFSKIVIQLKGKPLVITGGAKTPYIASVTFDGKPVESTWISWDELKNGGTLQFQLNNDADNNWGKEATLPSFSNK